VKKQQKKAGAKARNGAELEAAEARMAALSRGGAGGAGGAGVPELTIHECETVKQQVRAFVVAF